MTIIFHRTFTRDFKKLPSKFQKKFQDKLVLFEADQYNPTLNNHPLKGKYEGYRSINVSGDLRAVFRQEGKDVIFIAIDTHSNLYR